MENEIKTHKHLNSIYHSFKKVTFCFKIFWTNHKYFQQISITV